MMKKYYNSPKCEIVAVMNLEPVLGENSEPEVIGWLEGKENNDFFFDDDPFGSLWDDEPVEDPFSIDN